MQLKLFDDEQVKVTYWHYPFNTKGNYDYSRMIMLTEIISETRLPEFLRMLTVMGSLNIKYEKGFFTNS
jgi:hypothetical protein